jgi:O-acetylhomoserine (thiol)-lyase
LADRQASPGYVRLSTGIEHIDDILTDLDQALAKVWGNVSW